MLLARGVVKSCEGDSLVEFFPSWSPARALFVVSIVPGLAWDWVRGAKRSLATSRCNTVAAWRVAAMELDAAVDDRFVEPAKREGGFG